MPNVRLRTIINQDNSTTFQVQFHQGGEWEDLTWDMISDKPFETLDDSVFMVDENGVLTITDVPTVCSWGDISDKPFIFLDPDDFSVDASGKLSYTGSLDWTDITGKPFSTLDANDFQVSNGKLSVIHQSIPNQTWSQIQNKPFTSLDPTNFQVVGGVLYLNLNPEIPTWSNVQNKPFTYLDNSDFAVVGDTLKVKHQTIPDQNWSQIQQKPFETLDANDFTVDVDGKMSVNFPTPAPDDWDDVTNKPFESLNSTDFTVDGNGEASVNFPTPTPDAWDDVTSKPFETLNGTDFSVDQDGELSVNFPTPAPDDWADITNKPFTNIGRGFSVYDDYINVLGNTMTYVNNDSHKITTLAELRTFIQDFCRNSLENKLGVSTPDAGWYTPLLADEAFNICGIKLKLDNTQPDLTQYGNSYRVPIAIVCRAVSYNSSYDEFDMWVDVSGLPDYTDASKTLHLSGMMYFKANKTDGVYTSVGNYGAHMRSMEDTQYYFS